MRKKLLVLFLTAAAALTGAFALAGCLKEHIHTFDKQIAEEKYIKSAANCSHKAVYYYSCECGAPDTKTFEIGELNPDIHEFNQEIAEEKYLKSEANCTHKATYYLSCECGEKSTLSFEYGDLNPDIHTYNQKIAEEKYLKSEATLTKKAVYYYSCKCGKIGTETFEGENLYTINTKRLKFALNKDGNAYLVTEINSQTETSIFVPAEYRSLPVTRIGARAFNNCTSLKNITIPDSVTSIGEYAFNDCTELTNVTLGNGVTSIGNGAFNGCSSLTSITLPNSVTSIGDYAFYNCTELKNVTLGNGVTSIGNGAFYRCHIETATIPAMAISHIKNLALKNIVITSGDSICGGEFSNCTSLTSITIPNSVTSLGNYAFWGCTSLKNVTLGNGVNSIGNGAFNGCSSLTSITLPNSVTSLGDYAFYNCTELKNVTLGNGVTSIGDYAFEDCTELTNVTLGNGVTNIGFGTFRDCTSLTNIYYTGDIASWCGINGLSALNLSKVYIGNQKLNEITSIVIPDGVTSIGEYAFRDCTSLTSITLPNSVTSIGDRAFNNCTSLKNVTIPDSVTSLGDYAFEECTELTNVTLGNGVTNIGFGAFWGCTSLTSIYYTGNIASWCGINGLFTINHSKVYIGNQKLNEITSIVIPDGVTSIGEYAFRDCTSLTSINIPNSVTSIGDWAFSSCHSLTNIDIPNSVTSIGDSAFRYCRLNSIVIPSGVTEVGEDAFEMPYPITIYCVRTEKPDGWVDCWYGSNTVVWNYYKYISDESCKGEKVSAEEWQQAVSRDNYADENYEVTSACWGYVNYNRVDKQDGNKNYGLCVGNGVNADYWNAESYMVTTDSTYTIYSKDSDGWYAFPADYNIMNSFKSTPFKHTPLLCDFSKFTYDEKTGCYVYNAEEFSPIISAEIKFCDGKLAFLQYSEYQDQEFFDQRSIVTRTVNYKYGTAAITLPNI